MTDIREELARSICFEDSGRITAYDVWEKSLRETQRNKYRRMADALLPFIARVRAEERERCARVADKYADNPVGDERQETLEAFNVGMTYRTGGCDNGSAIAAAIRAMGDE